MTGVEVDKGLARLREPFPAEHVGLLPRITCPNCSKAQGRCCNEHAKSKCDACGNYITGRHMHLDYVGHGAVTDRLLEVDPGWSWEPLGFDQDGMPTFVYGNDGKSPVAFWIRLTVLGVTRLGVGSCEQGQFDAEKVLIGDALRNAAMRFGVALDLWIKGHAEDDERTSATSDRTSNRGAPPPSDPANTIPAASPEQVSQILAAIEGFDADTKEKLKGWAMAKKYPDPHRLNVEQAEATLAKIAELAGPDAQEFVEKATTEALSQEPF